MSYTDHLHDESEKASWRLDTSKLRVVTTFSKVLAGVLFVFLPFGGFWLGMQYAPVVYVEAPTSEPGTDAADTEDEATNDSDDMATTTSRTGTDRMREYQDSEVGISFLYPVEWGVIQTADEPGDCPVGYQADSCLMRRYSVQDPATGDSAIFMVAATAGHGAYPIARGAFWGDLVHQSAVADATACASSDTCTTYTNQAGLTFAKYAQVPEGGNFGWYALRRDTGDFTRFGLSAVNLSWTDVTAAEFAATVVDSLQVQ